MALRMADLMDGEMHLLTPGEDFSWPVDKMVVDFEEIEEETDEPLGPYESAALRPILSDTPYLHGAWMKGEDDRIKHRVAQGWGSFAVAWSTLIHVIGGRKHQFQRPQRGSVPDIFEFQFDSEGCAWEGGRL